MAGRRGSPPVDPSRLPATLPQSHRGPESLHESRHRGSSEARRCSPESVQGSILFLSPLSHLLSPLCPFGPRKGDVPSGVIPSPRRPLSRAAGGAAASRARDRRLRGLRASTSELALASRDFRAAKPRVNLATCTPSPDRPSMAACEPRKLVHILCIGEFFWGAEFHSFYHILKRVWNQVTRALMSICCICFLSLLLVRSVSLFPTYLQLIFWC